MANFAELNENNVVVNVLYVNDSECLDENGIEQESIGISYLKNLFGQDVKYVQTYLAGNVRKMLAGIGYIYDEQADVFHEQQPFPSWSIDSNFDWQPPTPMPVDENKYIWNEQSLSWDVYTGLDEEPTEQFINP